MVRAYARIARPKTPAGVQPASHYYRAGSGTYCSRIPMVALRPTPIPIDPCPLAAVQQVEQGVVVMEQLLVLAA